MDALRHYRGLLLVVSHDREFLRHVRVDEVLAIRAGCRDDALAVELSQELLSGV